MKTLILSSCMALSAVAGARAADEAAKPAPDRSMMIERHEKMAEMHKKTAECLKSAKAVKECHDAMMKDAPAKPGDCAFMAMAARCAARAKERGGMRGKAPAWAAPTRPRAASCLLRRETTLMTALPWALTSLLYRCIIILQYS